MSTVAPQADQAPPCPDPSAHARDTSLQDQASKAALYVTHDQKSDPEEKQIEPLGPDGKLSSAGAAASLKHAKPKDLPSFPSVGIEQDKSGNAAANIANQNHKAFEHWKPELSSNASKAALLAHKDGGKLNLWQPSSSDAGHSAAGLAMGKQKGLSPQVDYGYTDDGRKKALLAATLSTSMKPKPKAEPSSDPQRYPDAENASANALNAASVAHRPSTRTSAEAPRVSSPANEAARLTHLQQGSVDPKMFTDHPPIGPDHGSAALRGATASMAKDKSDKAKIAAEVPATTLDAKAQAQNYMHLQETAQKLAAERLAKLNPDSAQVYREHYGYGQEPKHKLSIRNRKGRSSSEGQGDGDDRAGAKRIQNQMNKFNDELAGLDSKKRTQDRTSLMAAAEKAVKARMSGIDQDIFEQTGKVTPQMMEQWEAKARAKAAADSEKRMENHGLVHIGGGKYMDQAEIDAIAQGRMQPTLDEIAETAENRRARDEEIRLDQEQRKAQALKEKEREKETAEEVRKQKSFEKMQAQFEKDIEKRYQREIKDAEKAQKEQDKATKKAAKQEAKELKRQRKEQDRQFKAEQEGTGIAERRSDSVSSSSSSEDETRGVTSTDTAPTVDQPAVASTAPVESSAEPVESSTALVEPSSAPEEPPSAARATTDLSDSEPTTALPAAQDPPGVPTDFSQSPPQNPTTSPNFQSDSGPAARRAENKVKHTVEEGTTGPKTKRDSRVKSLLGKFKRSSTKAEEEKQKQEEEENHSPSKGERAAEEAAKLKGGPAPAVDAGEAKTSADTDADKNDLYSAPSNANVNEPSNTTTTGAPTLPNPIASRSRSVSPISAPTSPSAKAFVSPPEGAGVSEELRGRVVSSGSRPSGDEFEEAMDRFDNERDLEEEEKSKKGKSKTKTKKSTDGHDDNKDEKEDAAAAAAEEDKPKKSKLEALGLPKIASVASSAKGKVITKPKGKDESPARTTSSKFQEEL